MQRVYCVCTQLTEGYMLLQLFALHHLADPVPIASKPASQTTGYNGLLGSYV